MLIRLVYASMAHSSNNDAEIDNIVAFSLAHNARAHITGVLAFDGSRIAQILEGPAEAVTGLFERILVDRRHSGVVELLNVEIDDYKFADWGMVRRPIADIVIAIGQLSRLS